MRKLCGFFNKKPEYNLKNLPETSLHKSIVHPHALEPHYTAPPPDPIALINWPLQRQSSPTDSPSYSNIRSVVAVADSDSDSLHSVENSWGNDYDYNLIRNYYDCAGWWWYWYLCKVARIDVADRCGRKCDCDVGI